MKTKISIEKELLEKAQNLTGIASKEKTVEAALQLLIRIHAQSKIRDYRGKLTWEGDLDEMRRIR